MISFPLNTVLFSMISKQRRRVLKYSDLRVKMMNEILSGIRVIKFYAWERPFIQEVSYLRGKELHALTQFAYTTAIGFSLVLTAVPLFQPVLVFLTYVAIQDEPLTAATAFTTIALFGMMRFPFSILPMGLSQYVQCRISLSRLERYLILPVLAQYVQLTPPPKPTSPSEEMPGSVTIRNGTFAWVRPDPTFTNDNPEVEIVFLLEDDLEKRPIFSDVGRMTFSNDSSCASSTSSLDDLAFNLESAIDSNTASMATLNNISCHIPAGSLVAVVGSVGSGKSSFLSAILGDMEPFNDSKVYTPRSGSAQNEDENAHSAYCSQTPWVVNDTLQGNILFGRAFDAERYEQVLYACALRDDIEILPAGDKTEIGEHGINLSGGQKARVALARALYAPHTQLLLLDDPLSAVDARVGEHLFTKAIQGPVARNKTRILVTHQVHLLSRCDSVIVLHDGTIQHQGKYDDLIAQGVDFAGAIDITPIEEADHEYAQTIPPSVREEPCNININDDNTSNNNTNDNKANQAECTEQGKAQETQKDYQKRGETLMEREEQEKGSVAVSAYAHYAKQGGYFIATLIFVVQAVGRAFEIGSIFWLALWAD